jgi:hypothetical protein
VSSGPRERIWFVACFFHFGLHSSKLGQVQLGYLGSEQTQVRALDWGDLVG